MGWGFSLVVEHLPSKHKALPSTLSSALGREKEGWGEEEREFAIRLFNLGIRRRTMIFSGVQFHLYHPTRKDDGALERNGDRLRATIASGATRCKVGIDQYLDEEK